MAVGALRSIVLDVNDIEEAERFWSAVLGLEVQFDVFENQYSRIGAKGGGPSCCNSCRKRRPSSRAEPTSTSR